MTQLTHAVEQAVLGRIAFFGFGDCSKVDDPRQDLNCISSQFVEAFLGTHWEDLVFAGRAAARFYL